MKALLYGRNALAARGGRLHDVQRAHRHRHQAHVHARRERHLQPPTERERAHVPRRVHADDARPYRAEDG